MVEFKPQPWAPEPRSLPSRLGCHPQSRRRIRRTCCLRRRTLGSPLELTSSPVRLVRWGVVPHPGLLCPPPREFGGTLLPALALAVTCLLACLQDTSWMLIRHRRGDAVCRFPCSKGADGAPATLGCFRRLEERWQSFSWELAGLCLAPSWSFHAICHAEDTVGAGEEGPGVCGTLSPICGHFCGLLVLVSPVS